MFCLGGILESGFLWRKSFSRANPAIRAMETVLTLLVAAQTVISLPNGGFSGDGLLIVFAPVVSVMSHERSRDLSVGGCRG